MKRIFLFFLVFISASALFASSDTDLINAVQGQDADNVLSALKKGANPDTVNAAGEPVLFIAVNTLNPKIVKILIDNGADLYIKDADGRNVTKIIIIKQADIQLSALETEDSDLKNKINKIKEIQTIIEKAKEKKLTENPNEALIYSAGLCDLEGIKKALNNKADINYQDKTGNTALHTVAQKNAVISKIKGSVEPGKIIEYLLKQGIDPKIKNTTGQTALHFAVQAQSITTLKLLLSKGIGINETDNYGMTPLMASVYNYDSDIAVFLLKSGADPELKDTGGKTALDRAIELQKEYTPPKDNPYDKVVNKKFNPYDDVVKVLKEAMKK
jgi:ankyrin repeat protein